MGYLIARNYQDDPSDCIQCYGTGLCDLKHRWIRLCKVEPILKSEPVAPGGIKNYYRQVIVRDLHQILRLIRSFEYLCLKTNSIEVVLCESKHLWISLEANNKLGIEP